MGFLSNPPFPGCHCIAKDYDSPLIWFFPFTSSLPSLETAPASDHLWLWSHLCWTQECASSVVHRNVSPCACPWASDLSRQEPIPSLVAESTWLLTNMDLVFVKHCQPAIQLPNENWTVGMLWVYTKPCQFDIKFSL